ncbi:CzcABC family efflux RND transporter, transmembrane protein [Sideroxyarcus emersonii]|uniref:CzcABC family efflux RND transporter, transmembrane protein n=1 Tax=Sideroxyarcus emersonii TaxID=2764705 RepID=A0AAN2BZP2_9PROT|nr:CusA/CzcA family heavy metal efflux RND transporter [Sideroxyarcus emersonii]BCK88281.1 CzcABC family efflux RND transporter, transmembrane protein [Sideroxyarcus emersonii]
MLDKLLSFALQQRIFVLAAALVLAIVGWRAVQDMPIEAFPDVQDVQVQIVTQSPGQAPEEVERSITLPIEREMSGVPRMTQLRSVSITGLSVVTLTFADNTDDYFARAQVMEHLQNVTLPPGLQPGLAPLTNAVGEVYRYVLDAPGMSLNEVRALQDWVLRPALRQVPGVADVVSFGGTVKEYQIRINPFLLRKYGVSIDQVSQAIGANSSNAGGGVIRRGDEALVLRSIGLFGSLDDIANVVIAAKDGKTVLVKDIGEVAIGYRPRSGIVAFNEYDNIVQGIVQMTKGQNASKVVGGIKQRLDELSRKLPPGVKIVPYYDRTDLVRHTVHTVTENLIVGAILVVAILILFLRNWYAALSVAIIIPLAMLFAFILMDARGVSANLISLGAVDFGIIIDSAVVLVEALMVKLALAKLDELPQHRTYGWRIHLIKQTGIELGRPILFSKLIIILAFVPIFTFQRVEGKIFSPMAFTLTFALIGAILLTLTLVPTLLCYAVKTKDLAEKHSSWMHNLQERYRRLLVWAGMRRKTIVAAAVGMLAVALAGSTLLGSEFLPKLDEGNIWLTISLPPATALDKTKEVERQVRAILKSYPEVNNVTTQVGRPDDGTDPKGPNNLEIMADLNPHDSWRFADKEELIADMTRQIHGIPGVPTNFSQVIQDNVEEALSGVKGEIAIKIFGPDLEILEDKSTQVADIISGIRGAADVAAIKVGGQTELNITLSRVRMSRYGLNINDVNATIQTAFGGSAVNVFYEGDRRFDVTLRLAQPYRDAVEDVADLPIVLPTGGTLPLGSIADIEVRQGAARVGRESGGRVVAVKANLLGRDQGSFVAEAMQKVNEQVKLPPGYNMTWGGQFENQQRALKRLKVIVPLSVLMIFVLLFWAFKSMNKALLVILMVPFTLIGGFAGLALAGLHLSVSAAVGFIAVAGISVQNGVIMVEQFIEGMRNGLALSASVMEGAVARLRPILMTALMAGIGLMPAALSHGIGSETQRPFAVVIVGGIVSATLFTLVLLPLLFPVFAEEGRIKANPPPAAE